MLFENNNILLVKWLSNRSHTLLKLSRIVIIIHILGNDRLAFRPGAGVCDFQIENSVANFHRKIILARKMQM